MPSYALNRARRVLANDVMEVTVRSTMMTNKAVSQMGRSLSVATPKAK